MLSNLLPASALGLMLFGVGAAGAKAAVLTETIQFAFNTDGSQTVQLPLFDPRLGTLTAGRATLSGVVQPLLEIFNTGRSQVSLSVQEFLTLGTFQARTRFSFGGFIPNDTPVEGVLFPPMPLSASTSIDGQLAEFTGTGTLPFTLTLASPATLEQGLTVTGFRSLASASGAITFDYTYTPVPVLVSEPGSLALFGVALIGLALATWRRAGQKA